MQNLSAALTLLLLVSLLTGCSKSERAVAQGSYVTNTGDFGPFLLEQVVRRGARPKTNGLTPIPAEWRHISPGGSQTLIFVSGDRFSEIQSLLNAAFGEPDPAQGSTPVKAIDSESRMGWYSAEQIGVSVQFVGWTNRTHLNILGRARP